ncbi:hypothetical protein B0I21_11264 [Sphingobacterium paludis]|uniref:Uncharacterized protein n=1 Tax=Sphingobacterium paludis TaxID=1476465 RepID=A0A4R7CS21_9SPHI|nr:hypothetical protein B0I21_11264 [Sphingobacterium paludis]
MPLLKRIISYSVCFKSKSQNRARKPIVCTIKISSAKAESRKSPVSPIKIDDYYIVTVKTSEQSYTNSKQNGCSSLKLQPLSNTCFFATLHARTTHAARPPILLERVQATSKLLQLKRELQHKIASQTIHSTIGNLNIGHCSRNVCLLV